MAKKFKDLMAKMSPEAQAEVRLGAALDLARMDLAEIRLARGATQSEVAARLGIAQSTVSGFESKEDWMVGTLQKYVEALGGHLRISAKFPEGEAVLTTGK